MHGKGEYTPFILEKMCGTITLMQVTIDHCYFIHALFQRGHCRVHDIVQVAETLGMIPEGMMESSADMVARTVL
jgi:hypothetical protein